MSEAKLVPYLELPPTPERTESWLYRQFPYVQDLYRKHWSLLQPEPGNWWGNWASELSICLEESIKESNDELTKTT